MAKKQGAGNSRKNQYKAYAIKNQWRKNKEAKLLKRVKENENDTHALEVFMAGKKVIGRKKPGTKGWFAPQEANLLRLLKSADDTTAKVLRQKLANLREVHEDKRPSAIRSKKVVQVLPTNIAKQLLDTGIINAKRYKTAEQKLGIIRHRRAISNR